MALPTDPIMLLSVVNLKLRDYFKNLDALCEDLDLSLIHIFPRSGTANTNKKNRRLPVRLPGGKPPVLFRMV